MQSMPDLPVEGVIASWISLLRRRWLVGAAVFLLVLGFAALQILSARPVYRADAKLRIGEPPPTTGLGAGSVLGFMRLGGDPFANDLELLNSRTVAAAVVRDVALTVSVMAPRGWYRDSLFQSLSINDSTPKARFAVRWVTDDRIEVKQSVPIEKQIGTFAAGSPARFGGLDVVFRRRRPTGPQEITLSTRPFGDAVRNTESRIKVARRRRDANVAEIVATDSDPAIAQQIVSSALHRFTELRARIADREVVQNVDSLRRVAQQTLMELKSAEADLEQLQRESLLVDPTTQTAAFVGRYSAATTQLESTRAELQTITSVLQRASTVEAAAERWTRLLAYRPFLSNVTIGELLALLNELEAKRAMLAPRRTENNREYGLVLDQIAYLDRSLTALARDVQLSLQETERRVQSQVASMEAALAAVPRSSIELARRQRSTRMLSEVLILTEQRLRQEELKQALSFSNVQVIDPPALRFRPVWPRKKLGLAVGWLVAVFCGVLTMAVVEQADRRVRRASDLMRLAGVPVLGVAVRSRTGLRFTAHELRAVVHHASANGRGPLRIVLAPVGATDASELAEQLRASFPVAVAHGGADVDAPEIVQAAQITDFASASAAAGPDVPVALVIDAERTTRTEVARAAALIRQAGGRLGGAIVICKSDRAAASIWA